MLKQDACRSKADDLGGLDVFLGAFNNDKATAKTSVFGPPHDEDGYDLL